MLYCFLHTDDFILSYWNRAMCIYIFLFLPCRPKSWIEEQEMGSFLSVAKGSEEPPVFLEIHYKGSPNASEPPLVFVGKGITFDRYLFIVSMLCILVNALYVVVLFGVWFVQKYGVWSDLMCYFKCIRSPLIKCTLCVRGCIRAFYIY